MGARLALPRPFADPHAISIHAPAWGRDLLDTFALVGGRNFNPRARMGARPDIDIVDVMSNAISIHAPAWGRD